MSQGSGVGRDPLIAAGAAVVAVLLTALLLATIHEVVIAVSPAPPPDEPPTNRDGWFPLGVALVAMLVAGALVPLGAFSGRLSEAAADSWPVVALCVAAFSFVLAHALTYDSYGGHPWRRYVEYGIPEPAWIAALGVLAAITSFMVWSYLRVGLLASGAFIWLCMVTAFFTGVGH